MILAAGSGAMDNRAQEVSGAVFRQALLTFAAARGLDAAVSLAQGTEIVLQPAGVGVTLSAGEVLDPIDDLVEQFSSVMLVSTTSLGIQNLLLGMSRWWVLSALVMLLVAARVVVAWFPERVGERARRFLGGALTLLLIVRFAMPIYALGTAFFFAHFLQPSQVEAVEALEEASADVREIEQLGEAAEREAGWMSRVSEWFSGAVENLDVQQRIAAFQARVARTVENVLHLLVVFVLQTVLLPLAFLWALPRAFRFTVSRLG